MSTVERPLAQEEADSREVARLVAEGKPVTDPELRRRIEQRGDQVRKAMLEKHGITDIAAELTDPDE
jgi:hypothetical protein